MWKVKKWRFTEHTVEQARAKMQAWLELNKGRIEYEEIFVDNAFAVEYRVLRQM